MERPGQRRLQFSPDDDEYAYSWHGSVSRSAGGLATLRGAGTSHVRNRSERKPGLWELQRVICDFEDVELACLTMQPNFTWGKALGTQAVVQATSEQTVVDPFNLANSYGVQPFDRKFVYNLFMVCEPTVFRTRHGFFGRVLGGWSFSPIFAFGSGLPLQINTLNGDAQAFGEGDGVNFFAVPGENGVLTGPYTGGTSRHDGVTGSNGIGTAGNVNMFTDPAAVWAEFRNPILGVDGKTGGAGPVRGMPFWNLDLQVKKNVHIAERFSAEFQSIFSNVLNHDQLADPVLDLSSPTTFGVLGSQVNAPRSIELGFRLRF